MGDIDFLAVVQAHTRYDVKCECGEYLLKREHGFMSSRDQWEQHFADVLRQEFGVERCRYGWMIWLF